MRRPMAGDRRSTAAAAMLSAVLLLGGCAGGADRMALARVNAEINAAGAWRTDVPGTDDWRPLRESGWIGDCEDFALEKGYTLIERGWPRDRLSIAIFWDPRAGGWHAVLIARDEAGRARALDNTRRELRPWNRRGYEWQIDWQRRRRRLVAADGVPWSAGRWVAW